MYALLITLSVWLVLVLVSLLRISDVVIKAGFG